VYLKVFYLPPSFILAHCRHGYTAGSPFRIGGRTKLNIITAVPPFFSILAIFISKRGAKKKEAYNRGRQLGVITKTKNIGERPGKQIE
jgi:hypothetical protein